MQVRPTPEDNTTKGKSLDDLRGLAEEQKITSPAILSRQFTLSVKITIPGEEKEGFVSLHIPSAAERIKAARIMGQLLGSMPLDALDHDAVLAARAIGYLTVAIDDGPAWLTKNFADLDYGLILTIFSEAIEYENQFFRTGIQDQPGDPNAKPGNDAKSPTLPFKVEQIPIRPE